MDHSPKMVALPASKIMDTTSRSSAFPVFLTASFRTRRIKCDEEKPSCLRCARSYRVCQGYPDSMAVTMPIRPGANETRREALLSYRPQIISSPSRALTIGCIRSERQRNLAQFGLSLLSLDSFSRFGAAGIVLNTLLPQLCLTIPSICVAATALGAVHQLRGSPNLDNPTEEAFAASQYQMALRAMQRDLYTQPDGPIPLIMMCFILSVAEILWQQETNAIIHLRAASQLLQIRRNAQLLSRSTRRDTFDTDLRSTEDEIGIILRTVDFQICSYAPSRPPDLPAISVPPVLPSVTDISTAHITLIQLAHTCYDFTRTAYKFKYQPQSANPSIYIEQGRHVAHLSTWLEQLNLAIIPTLHASPTDPTQATSCYDALTLRMTALSILIHLSCILTPYETAFNAHAPHFQQIVTDGEAVMSMRQREAGLSLEGTGPYHFRTGPGIVQPLFLTAFKYRHRHYRRRAITLLSTVGREGPWSGRREARITSRLMELEEMRSRDSSRRAHDTQSTTTEVHAGARENIEERLPVPSSTAPPLAGRGDFDSSRAVTERVQALRTGKSSTEPRETVSEQTSYVPLLELPESALINNMGMSSDTSNGRPSHRVIVRFTKCHDMKAMLSYPCGHGIGQTQNLDSHILGPCINNPFWDRWEEVLEF